MALGVSSTSLPIMNAHPPHNIAIMIGLMWPQAVVFVSCVFVFVAVVLSKQIRFRECPVKMQEIKFKKCQQNLKLLQSMEAFLGLFSQRRHTLIMEKVRAKSLQAPLIIEINFVCSNRNSLEKCDFSLFQLAAFHIRPSILNSLEYLHWHPITIMRIFTFTCNECLFCLCCKIISTGCETYRGQCKK